MIFINSKKIVEKCIEIVINFVIIAGFILFNTGDFIKSIPLSARDKLCVADIMIDSYAGLRGNICLFALIFINIYKDIKYDFMYTKLYIVGSRVKMYYNQIIKSLVNSFMYSITYIYISYSMSKLDINTLINWSSQESYYFKVTQSIVTVYFMSIIIEMFLSVFLLLQIVQTLYIVLSWIVNIEAVKWIAVLLIIFFSTSVLKIPIFVNISLKQYSIGNVIVNIVISFILLMMLIISGVWISKRKQYYRPKR